MKEYVHYRIVNRPSGRTLLHSASTDAEILQLIKGFSLDPMMRTLEDETPLLTLIKDGKREQAFALLEVLSEKGIHTYDEKDMYGRTALDVVRVFGDKELEDRLLGYDVQGKKQPAPSESMLERSAISLKNFFVAKNNAQEDLVKDLFKQYLQQPSIKKGVSFLQKLPKNIPYAALAKEAAREDLYTGLTFMHKIKNPEQVPLLMLIGADFNKTSKEGQNALHYMIKTGSFDAACALLRCSQMVNVDTRDVRGMTPLCYAIIAKHEELTKILLERGADVFQHFILNKKCSNPCLLFLKPEFYTPTLVPLLAPAIIAEQANIEKMSILHRAFNNGYEEIIQAVLGDKNYNYIQL